MTTGGGIELPGGVGYAQARPAGQAGGTGPPPLPGPRRRAQGVGMRAGGGARRVVAAQAACGTVPVIDIAPLPKHRGAGSGSRLLRARFDEAEQGGKPVRMHVRRSTGRGGSTNVSASQSRLGLGDEGVSCVLQWRPAHVR
jgi:hypothetical protein